MTCLKDWYKISLPRIYVDWSFVYWWTFYYTFITHWKVLSLWKSWMCSYNGCSGKVSHNLQYPLPHRLSCRRRCSFLDKSFLQNLHWNFLQSCTVCICRVRLNLFKKEFPQISHTNDIVALGMNDTVFFFVFFYIVYIS